MVDRTADPAGHLSDIDVRGVGRSDLNAISALHEDAFGPGRFTRTAYRVREGTPHFSPHCRAGWRGDALVGAVTMTAVTLGDATGAHWLLGPLAVRANANNKGLGQRLVKDALRSVESACATATVILVGDVEYYGRLGFEAVPRGTLLLPGPVDPSRLLIWRGSDGAREIPAGLIKSIATPTPAG
ncbi:MAG: N-acetyltransferase [Hyphomicrobiaceae bacterium]